MYALLHVIRRFVYLLIPNASSIHKDIRSRKSVATHWGTFNLTDEPLDEPPKRLAKAKMTAGVPDDEFMVLMHGETVTIDGSGNNDEDH